MKRILGLLVLGLALTSLACTNEDSGGPGVRTTQDQNQVVPPANTFRVDLPEMPQTLKQGESKTMEVKIDREKNFDQNVTVTFSGLPTGVSVDPSEIVIAPGDTGIKATVKAEPDAALGEFDIVANGKPATGAVATTEWKLKVEK